MTEFSKHANGSPCWVDLMSSDIDGSQKFYRELFGWEIDEQFDDGERIYTMFTLNGHNVAGLGGMPPGADNAPSAWHTYICVDDIGATTTAVQSAGGSIMMPEMKIFDSGSMAVFVDPTGAVFSVWQPNEHIGAQLANDFNTWSWNELNTRDVDTARTFYSSVFGWEYEETDAGMGPYYVIQGGENGGYGGMLNMPPGIPEIVPNHWIVYFTVENISDTIARVKELGGAIRMEPFDAGDVGTIAIIHDDINAAFAIIQAPSE